MSEYWTALGIKNYGIFQDTEDYAFTQDSVFLANTAIIRPSERVLDLGTGCGILAVLAAVKKHAASVTGIELQTDVADMAKRSVAANGLSDKIEIIQGDVCDIKNLVKAESFDKVLCNPPYFTPNAQSEKEHLDAQNAQAVSATSKRAISRSGGTVDAFISAASYALRFGGDLYIVYKLDGLSALFSALFACKLEPKHIIFVYPKLSAGVDVVIVRARKGGKAGMTSETLIVMDENGNYTDKTKELYS